MFNAFTSIFRRRKSDEESDTEVSGSLSAYSPPPRTLKRSFDKVSQWDDGTSSDNSSVQSNSSSGAQIFKRLKLSDGSHAEQAQQQPTPDSTSEHRKDDRRLMPPPSISLAKASYKLPAQTPSPQVRRIKAELEDDTQSIRSQTSPDFTHRLTGSEKFQAERARRYVDATRDPDDAHTWSSTERELFYHLAMRGYDPILPNNWTLDFKTLPLALFAPVDEQEALICSNSNAEFRAIRALRQLLETGRTVRDKMLASPGSSIESTISRGILKYLKWAMNDAGIYHDHEVLPVHHIISRIPGKSTTDLINDLEDALHHLARQHAQGGVLPSIEHDNDTPVLESSSHSDPDHHHELPTLTGFLVTYSLVYLWTMNPNYIRVKAESDADGDDELRIRFIAKFDFSDAGMDVWNGLSIAIVCVMLRKVYLERGVEVRSLDAMQDMRFYDDDPDR
jgi:hypothetical protein